MTLTIAHTHPAEQPRHVHDSLILGVVTAGARRLTTPEQSVCVPAGGVFALPPAQAHACAPEGGPCAYLAFSIEASALPPALASQLEGKTATCLPQHHDDTALASSLCRLAEAVQEQTGSLERQSLLAEALERLALLGAGPGGDPPGLAASAERAQQEGKEPAGQLAQAVLRAKGLLEEEREAALSLPELASACGMDMYALHRAFTRLLGLPPHAYQTHLRLRRAKALLRAGASPGQAALEAGFCDQSHLNRHFVRLVGLTPVQYAKAHKGEGEHPRSRAK